METLVELLVTAGRFLVGIWPVMFVVLLFGIFKKKNGFGDSLRASIKALIVTWLLFAALRMVFNKLDMETFQFIPEPLNSRLFLFTGLLLLPLVLAIFLEARRKISIVKSLEDMRALSASEFENLVADTYREQGHHVDVVGSRGDHGIDLVVHTRKGETWLVQCKKYRGKVGEPVVRDFYGALRASEATSGAIVTTGQITDSARLWAEGKPLHLYDGQQFMRVIQSTRTRRSLPFEAKVRPAPQKESILPVMENPFQPAMEMVAASEAPRVKWAESQAVTSSALEDKTPFSDKSSAPDCPVCGIPMVLNQQKRFLLKPKELYICSNAPVCPETRPVD